MVLSGGAPGKLMQRRFAKSKLNIENKKMKVNGK